MPRNQCKRSWCCRNSIWTIVRNLRARSLPSLLTKFSQEICSKTISTNRRTNKSSSRKALRSLILRSNSKIRCNKKGKPNSMDKVKYKAYKNSNKKSYNYSNRSNRTSMSRSNSSSLIMEWMRILIMQSFIERTLP